MAGNYIRRGGLDVQPGPWLCEGLLHAYIFYVPAKGPALQQLCNRSLNDPSGNHLKYAPVPAPLFGHYVALTFQHFDRLTSDLRCGYQKGKFSYNEASFWVPVKNGAGQLEMFIPYMFVNNWIALAAGREVYGFPKEYADELAMPQSDAGRFSVKALTLANEHVPTEAKCEQILECVPDYAFVPSVDFLKLADIDLWPLIEKEGDALLANPLAKLLLGPIWDIIKVLLSRKLPLVFVRQLRALGGGEGADLQQIVTAMAQPFAVRNLRLRRQHVLTVTRLASHPIVPDLGLPDYSVPLPTCVELQIEFGLQNGAVLWPRQP